MGWSVVIAAGPLVRAVPRPGIFWLAAGGLLGSGCHFLAVLFYVVPSRLR